MNGIEKVVVVANLELQKTFDGQIVVYDSGMNLLENDFFNDKVGGA